MRPVIFKHLSFLACVPWLTMLSAAPLSSCTLAADLGRFESADDLDQDLVFELLEFVGPHQNHDMFFEVVGLENQLASIAVISPLGGDDVMLRIPRGIPEGPHSFQFWADVDENDIISTSAPGLDGLDHSWLLPDARDLSMRRDPDSVCPPEAPEEAPSEGEDTPEPMSDPRCFRHVVPFDVLEEPETPTEGFVVEVTNLTETTGFVEMQLVEVDDVLRTRAVRVIYRRTDTLGNTTVRVTMPGAARPDQQYELVTYADLNNDGEIDRTEVDVSATVPGANLSGTFPIMINPDEPVGSIPPEGPLFTALIPEGTE